MRLHELHKAISDAWKHQGNLEVEVCRFTAEDKKYYWMSSCFVKGDRFIIGYNIDSFRKNNGGKE